MFRMTLTLTLLVLVCVYLAEVDGGRRRRRRRRRRGVVYQTIHHHSVNNCNCGLILQLMKEIKELKAKIGRRDVAAILDLDEDYPGLDNFVDHLNSKRNLLDIDELDSLIKRHSQSSYSHSPNYCHCGRSLVDQFNMESL